MYSRESILCQIAPLILTFLPLLLCFCGVKEAERDRERNEKSLRISYSGNRPSSSSPFSKIPAPSRATEERASFFDGEESYHYLFSLFELGPCRRLLGIADSIFSFFHFLSSATISWGLSVKRAASEGSLRQHQLPPRHIRNRAHSLTVAHTKKGHCKESPLLPSSSPFSSSHVCMSKKNISCSFHS